MGLGFEPVQASRESLLATTVLQPRATLGLRVTSQVTSEPQTRWGHEGPGQPPASKQTRDQVDFKMRSTCEVGLEASESPSGGVSGSRGNSAQTW